MRLQFFERTIFDERAKDVPEPARSTGSNGVAQSHENEVAENR